MTKINFFLALLIIIVIPCGITYFLHRKLFPGKNISLKPIYIFIGLVLVTFLLMQII